MKNFAKTMKIVGNVVLWLFVLFAVAVTLLVFSAQNNREGLANIGGNSLVTVLTNSMHPTFDAGDLIFVKTLSNDEKNNCKVGDIISYNAGDLNGDNKDDVNTHKIVDKYDDGGYTYYITRGDNTSGNDEPVVSSDVLGKYSGKRIAGFGKVINFLQSTVGFLCVIVIPLVLFFLFELYNFISVIIKSKLKSKLSAEDEEEIKRRAVEEYLKQQNSEAESASTPEPVEETSDKN